MRGRVGYLSAAVFAVVVALGMQFSFASAQQPSSGHPTPECQACATACELAFEACKANGEEKSKFGKCARDLEQCAADCRQPGGACHPGAAR